MSFHFRSALLVLVASAGLSFAQGDVKKELPKSTDVEVRMADGSTMRMVIAQESLTVATKYGKLTVAMNEILRIDLGLRMPEGAAAKIDKAVQQLGSRELKLKDHDVIKTTEFTIVGRIEDGTLNAKTTYFGEVKLDLANVRSLRSLARSKGTEVSVDAAKYCVPGGQQWLDTGVEVEALAELTVTASGQINPGPNVLGPGQNMSGPAGNPNLGVAATGHTIGALLGASARLARSF